MVDDSLRQRLAAELAEADPCCGLTHADDYADAAFAVFAAWLRERGRETEAGASEPSTARTVALVRADTMFRLADEIAPNGDDHA